MEIGSFSNGGVVLAKGREEATRAKPLDCPMKILRRFLLRGDEERFSAFALFVLVLTAAVASWNSVPLWFIFLSYGGLLVVVFALEEIQQSLPDHPSNHAKNPPHPISTRDLRGNNGVGQPADATVIDPRWRSHLGTLLKLRRHLLVRRHLEFQEVGEPLEPCSLHEADQGTDEFDHDLVLADISSHQQMLLEIDDAIHRIMAGTYGVCEKTGEAIPESRLRAVPWTRFSLQAKAAFEKEGKSLRHHLGGLSSVRDRRPKIVTRPSLT